MLWSIGDVCHGLGEKDGEDGHTWVAGGGGVGEKMMGSLPLLCWSHVNGKGLASLSYKTASKIESLLFKSN